MFKNFFQARDELDRAIDADEIKLAAQALAIFRFLLSHAFYDYEPHPERYGRVNCKVWGTTTIARLTGCSERTARDHLRALEDAKLIHRQGRAKWAAGRQEDEIAIIWAVFHTEDEAEPADLSTTIPADLSTIPADLSNEPADLAGIFSIKNLKNHQEGVAAPSGENQGQGQGQNDDRAKDDSLVEVDGPVAVPSWDGDIDRLVIPARFDEGAGEYLVSADGVARPVRGKPRPGEVRAKLNFQEIRFDRLERLGHARATSK